MNPIAMANLTRNTVLISKAKRREELVTRKQLDKILNKKLEEKYLYHYGDQSIASTGFTINLTDISVGAGSTNRVGNDVNLVSLELNSTIECVDTHNAVRLLIYRWRPDSTIDGPSIIDILNLAAVSATVGPVALKDEAIAHKSIILVDEVFTLTLSNDELKHFRTFIKIPPTVTRFISSATTGMDQIYMSLVSDSAASSHPIFHYYVKLKFTDA